MERAIRLGAARPGMTFAIWVITLQAPLALGFYDYFPSAPDANRWSILVIAIAMWGGLRALRGR